MQNKKEIYKQAMKDSLKRAKGNLAHIEDIQKQADGLGAFDVIKKAELAEKAVHESVELSKRIIDVLTNQVALLDG